MPYRFHVLSIPHTATSPEFNACAFTTKVLRLCKMLKSKGHYVIHYGREDSQVECDEHVSVTTKQDWADCYGDYEWKKEFFKFDVNDSMYTTYDNNSIAEITKRKQKNDFLLCPWGFGNFRVAEAHRDLICVESGIGYSSGYHCQFKVFESYSLLRAYQTLDNVATACKMGNYDAVIPNYFDENDFTYQPIKQDYFLHLGRLNRGKGLDIAMDAAKRLGVRLILAGQGNPQEFGLTEWPEHVEYVGYADVDKRKELMANARALILLSQFNEPFGGTSIEAMLSGTPIITSDFGCFYENNLHGLTGYRVRTFGHLMWAMQNIDKINPKTCYDWASKNFNMHRVADMYEQYWDDVMNIFTGNGWYEPHKSDNLDWLKRIYPQ